MSGLTLSRVHDLIEDTVALEMKHYQGQCSRELVEHKYSLVLDLLKSINVNLDLELKFIIQDLANGTFHRCYNLNPSDKMILARIGFEIFTKEYPKPVYIQKQERLNEDDNMFLYEYISRFRDGEVVVDTTFTVQDCIDSFK